MAARKDAAPKPNSVGADQDPSPTLLRARSQPVRNTPIDDQYPSLRRWRVIEVVSRTGTLSRHLYGHDVTNNAGRVSSAIQEFDLEAMTATTRSGRNYRLLGAPGSSRIGEYAWQDWCNKNGATPKSDVTDQYFSVDKLFSYKDKF